VGFSAVKIGPDNGLAFRGYMTADILEGLLKRNRCGVGLMTEEGKAAGALAASFEDGVLTIDSVCVDETVRRQGGGTLLINAAKSLARTLKAPSVGIQAPGGLLDTVLPFLSRCGFGEPERGSVIYTVNIQKAGESGILDLLNAKAEPLKKLTDLTSSEKESYCSLLRGPAQFAADPPGSPVEDASLCRVDQGVVTAFIMITRLDGGDFYMHALYANQAYSRILPTLLGASLRAVVDRSGGGGRLIIAASTEAARKLADKLLQDIPEAYTTETMWLFTANQTRGDVVLTIDKMKPELDILMPKLMDIGSILEELGVKHDLIVGENAPYLRVSIPEEAQIRCRCLAPESLDEFIYTVTCRFLPGDDPMELQLLCDRFNAASGQSFASAAHDGIYLRASLPEGEIPVTDEQFSLFWKLFAGDAASLRALILAVE
jgi:GNAT superfamily N-acetyltransferase